MDDARLQRKQAQASKEAITSSALSSPLLVPLQFGFLISNKEAKYPEEESIIVDAEVSFILRCLEAEPGPNWEGLHLILDRYFNKNKKYAPNKKEFN